MLIELVLEECYSRRTEDGFGGIMGTDVYKRVDGSYAVASWYENGEVEYCGFAESYNKNKAIKLSEGILEKDWKEK